MDVDGIQVQQYHKKTHKMGEKRIGLSLDLHTSAQVATLWENC